MKRYIYRVKIAKTNRNQNRLNWNKTNGLFMTMVMVHGTSDQISTNTNDGSTSLSEPKGKDEVRIYSDITAFIGANEYHL